MMFFSINIYLEIALCYYLTMKTIFKFERIKFIEFSQNNQCYKEVQEQAIL